MSEHELTEAFVDEHLDRVLRAAGSSLRNYTMPQMLTAMRIAMIDAMLAAREAK